MACFAFSALFWAPTGWFMSQCGRVRLEKKSCEQASSFCIFWWRLVLIYSRDTAWNECARETESHHRTRELLFPATPALSSGTTLPLFLPLSHHLLILSSLAPLCCLPTLNLFHPRSLHLTPLFSPPIDSASLPPPYVHRSCSSSSAFPPPNTHKFAQSNDLWQTYECKMQSTLRSCKCAMSALTHSFLAFSGSGSGQEGAEVWVSIA